MSRTFSRGPSRPRSILGFFVPSRSRTGLIGTNAVSNAGFQRHHVVNRALPTIPAPDKAILIFRNTEQWRRQAWPQASRAA